MLLVVALRCELRLVWVMGWPLRWVHRGAAAGGDWSGGW